MKNAFDVWYSPQELAIAKLVRKGDSPLTKIYVQVDPEDLDRFVHVQEEIADMLSRFLTIAEELLDEKED